MKKKAFHWLCRATQCSISDTVVIAGTERSGTTWLFELLSESEGYRALHEPLTGNSLAFEHGFGERNTISPDQCPDTKEAFIRDVLQGIAPQPSCWRFTSTSNVGRALDFVSNRKLVVKFVRANRMLAWLAHTFSPRGLVFIVRHPCATVASMKHFSRFKPDLLKERFGTDPAMQAAQERLPSELWERYADVLTSVDSYVGILAATWCLDHALPFHHHLKEGELPPWLLVPYEHLVLHPRDVLTRCETYLDVPLSDTVTRRVRKDSSSVWESQVLEPQAQVEKWKTKLSASEIDDVLSVVRRFGLNDLYDADPLPGVEVVNRYSGGAEIEADPLSFA